MNNNIKQKLEKKIDRFIFNIGHILGKGSYSYVYKGIDTLFSQQVAVKVIKKNIIHNKHILQSIKKQINILCKIKHPNIIELIGVFQTLNNIYIITELCDQGSLLQYIRDGKITNTKRALELIKQIIDGVYYLYSSLIVHRDLKPENIMVKKGKCKISDFGFASFLNYGSQTIMNQFLGSPFYMSPQILSKQSYTCKTDIWSLGICFYQILTGTVPWNASSQSQLLNKIHNQSVQFPPKLILSENVKDLVLKCLKIKEGQRLTMKGLLNHNSLVNVSAKKVFELIENSKSQLMNKKAKKYESQNEFGLNKRQFLNDYKKMQKVKESCSLIKIKLKADLQCFNERNSEDQRKLTLNSEQMLKYHDFGTERVQNSISFQQEKMSPIFRNKIQKMKVLNNMKMDLNRNVREEKTKQNNKDEQRKEDKIEVGMMKLKWIRQKQKQKSHFKR